MNSADRKVATDYLRAIYLHNDLGSFNIRQCACRAAAIQTALVWFDSAATIIWQSAGKPQTKKKKKKPLDQNPAIRLVKALKVCVGE